MALPPHISGSKSTALMSGQHCTTGELKYFYLCTNPTPNLLPQYACLVHMLVYNDLWYVDLFSLMVVISVLVVHLNLQVICVLFMHVLVKCYNTLFVNVVWECSSNTV